MKKLITGIILLMTAGAMAQETKTSPITISAYLEAYYNYDFNRPLNNTMPPFLYNFTRDNEVNLNLAYIKAAYSSDKVRGNFTFATGTYMNANYSAEPGLLKNIYEANIGVRLSSKNNLWIDAGVLPSHIGWESAVGKDNPTLSRSLAAENSPYFETGARLSYTSQNEKWYLSALVLNGWQRIQRIDGNTTPAFGTQVTFKPSSKITLNSSTFIGNDKPDSVRKMRYFHDFYGIFQLSDKWAATLGFDIGAEQKTKGSSDFNTWYTSALILKYAATSKTSIGVRAEYYNDKNGVIIATNTPNGFKTWGFSANVDYNILSNLTWRTEIRSLNSKDDIFVNNNNKTLDHNIALTTSLAFSF
ncbi:porin [Mucilaginibacter sp. 22184]|uniref:porin n=1 Tax=Mucilaginibacter sp. 22184 TaxID=3453887 RepID=UPI003F84D027